MLTAAIAMPSRPKQLNHQGHILEVAIEGATQAIIDRKNDLNQLGDEYYGSTMCGVAQAISRDMKKYYPLNDAAETVKEIGSSIRRVMSGTFGIIYDKFCSAAYEVLKANSHSDITPKHWADAFEAAINAVIEYIGASAGYRTLLDALVPACLVLKEELSAGKPPVEAFFLSSLAASEGADLTQFMHPQTYTPGEEGDLVTDPGAMAAATWYKAAALAVKGASS